MDCQESTGNRGDMSKVTSIWRSGFVKFLVGGFFVLVGFILVELDVWLYECVWRHHRDVAALIASLPPDEAEPPAVVKEVLLRLEGQGGIDLVTSKCLAQRCQSAKGRIGGWKRLSLAWYAMTPLLYSKSERMSLYCH
jgi:hypothetical protein